ncbi:transglutaminaseTgpA domain-containing protein [Oerskovia sp. NPDC060338]|uniref:transglutaminase family protein n=1 Tax=Oerskovia sp. NPDC060338 TaxID=3347100 RepID=UPI0036619531
MTTPTISTRRADLVRTTTTTALVLVATVASFHALTVLIGPGTWTRTGTVFVLVLGLVTWATRALLETRPSASSARARSLVPTVAGLLVGAWGLLAVFGGVTSRGIDLAISSASLDRVLARFAAGRQLIATETSPIEPSFPLVLIAVGGAALVFLLTDLIAGGLRLPAAAGLPLLALWIPPLVIEGAVPPAVFVVTVTALLLLVAVDNPHRAVRRTSGAAVQTVDRATRALRASTTLAATLAIALVALVAGSAAGALPQIVRSPWTAFFTSAGPTVRLASDLDMESNLKARSEEVALTYEFPEDRANDTSSTDVGPLRMFTLTGFDGRNWRRGDARQGPQVEESNILWPDDAGTAAGEPRQVDVTLRTLRDERLVLPTEPRTVAAPGEWFYDDARDEVTGNQATEPGMEYSFVVHPRDLTAQALRASEGGDLDDPNLLEVPASSHEEDIRALATEITAETNNRYDAAVALQSYFRDGSRFTYSTEVPDGQTDDTVWNFLQDRQGYCVQFATSMTMMARSIGIPARMAVGFLPGERTSDNLFEVTGKDSHAWPELYFPGQGWVRFEPTPAVQAGAVPSWADPLLAANNAPAPADPGEVPTNAATPNAPNTTAPTTGPAPDLSSGTGNTQDGMQRTWIIGASALAVLLALSALAWLIVRRRSEPVSTPDVESTWAELTERLGDLDIRWPASATLRNVPALVVAQVVARTGRQLPVSTTDALVTLTSAVEAERYARTWQSPGAETLTSLLEQVVTGVREGLSDRPAHVDGPSALPVG